MTHPLEAEQVLVGAENLLCAAPHVEVILRDRELDIAFAPEEVKQLLAFRLGEHGLNLKKAFSNLSTPSIETRNEPA